MPEAPSRTYAAAAGMKDILPEQAGTYRKIFASAASVFASYGYQEIQTPVMESTDLFARGIGETTDIVEKEMFTLKDEGLTLRPEGTASVVRAYVEHAMDRERVFRKFYYAGPFFRKERPQKGRLRQFHQVGIEAIGSDDPLLDAEVIAAACRFLDRTGLSGYELRINSIGCSDCRDDYRNALKEALAERTGDLCDNCRKRYERNVFRVLDCKEKKCRSVAAEAPTFRDKLCQGCSLHLDSVEKALAGADIDFVFDSHLVRGFDYYTRTVFEIVHGDLGAQNAVAGGGRYDGLVEELGGPPVPGVGFSAGCERIALALSDRTEEERILPSVYAVFVRKEQREAAFALITRLRAEGIRSDMNYEGRSLKAQMRAAERTGYAYAAILGPEEVEKNVVSLKNMESGEEKQVPIPEISSHII